MEDNRRVPVELADSLGKFRDLDDKAREAFCDLLSEHVEEAENSPLNKEFEIVIPTRLPGQAADDMSGTGRPGRAAQPGLADGRQGDGGRK